MIENAREAYRAISSILGASLPPADQLDALERLAAAIPEALLTPSDGVGAAPGVTRSLQDAMALVQRRVAIAASTRRARDTLRTTHVLAAAIARGERDLETIARRLSTALEAEVRIFRLGESHTDPLVVWAARLGRSAAYEDLATPEPAIPAPVGDVSGRGFRSALVGIGSTLGVVIASEEPGRLGPSDLGSVTDWLELLELVAGQPDRHERTSSLSTSILAALGLGVLVVDAEGRAVASNLAAAHLLSARPSELIAGTRELPPFVTGPRGPFDEGLLAHDNGKPLAVSLVRTPLAGYGELLSLAPLTHTRHELAHWRFLAEHDPLTGLLNRHGLHHALTARTGQRAAILYIDLDHFKAHNDRYGHLAGDHVITTLARRIGQVLAPEDLIARVGGDEFVVVHPVARTLDLRRFATRLRTQLIARPVSIGTRSLGVSVSLGAALETIVPDLDQLLLAADRAMYLAKRTGSKVEILRSGSDLLDSTQPGLLESDAFEALRTRNREAILPTCRVVRALASGDATGCELSLAWGMPRAVPPRTIARERHEFRAYNDLLLEALDLTSDDDRFVAFAPVRPDARLITRIARAQRHMERLVLIIEADELAEPAWFDDAVKASRHAEAHGLRVAIRWSFRFGGEIAQLARIRPTIAWLDLTAYPRSTTAFLEGLCRLSATLGLQVVLANRAPRPRLERDQLRVLLPNALIVDPDPASLVWRAHGAPPP